MQSVLVQEKLYVGGGDACVDSTSDTVTDSHIVMEYDTNSREWTALSLYMAHTFAMAAVDNKLVLIGGCKDDEAVDLLGVWHAHLKKWTHHFPAMPTARYGCSVAVYDEWLVVAGGHMASNSVELLNTCTHNWHVGPSSPKPLDEMKTAVVGDMCYMMGGYMDGCATGDVYCLSFKALLHYVHKGPDVQVWNEIAGLPIGCSSPLSINGSFLLAVGGQDQESAAVTTIYHYIPESDEWLKVGDLSSPRCNCTCVMIGSREIVVVGGTNKQYDFVLKTHIATVNTKVYLL